MNATEQIRAKTDAQPTATLVNALRIIEAIGAETPEQRLVRAAIIDALELRYPAASAAVQAAFDADEALLSQGVDTPGVDYVAVLLANIP